MKVLIVHAHNEPQSFNSAMARLAVEVLEDEGQSGHLHDRWPVQGALCAGLRAQLPVADHDG
ncbi:hypothetical protein [Pseudomonas sp. zfem002]|uniref:hypothetical protein n=1 Tax=Pseudomonas sp. zfem002 TaxID=3078197 RepID=UPI003977AA6B